MERIDSSAARDSSVRRITMRGGGVPGRGFAHAVSEAQVLDDDESACALSTHHATLSTLSST